MSYNITELDQDIVEPVTLEFQKAWSEIDADYATRDVVILSAITTARQLLESYLNIGLTRRTVELEWDGCPIELPLSPNGDIISLKDSKGVVVSADDYYTYGGNNKTIAVGVSATKYEYFYNLTNSTVDVSSSTPGQRNEVYKLVYETGYEVLINALKEAIATQADYTINNRGTESGLCSAAKAKAEPYSRNLAL